MCTNCNDPGTENPGSQSAEHLGRVVTRRLVLGGLAGSAVLLGSGGPAMASPPLASPSKPDNRPAHLELVLLGTRAGPPIDPYRAGTASALVVDGSTYLVDCGRAAVTQYVRAGLSLRSMRAIFLTHLHADHVADYYNFFLLGANPPNQLGDNMPDHTDVYGPGRAGGLPPKFGGGDAPTVNPASPTPGIADLTNFCHDAYAYNSNVFIRDTGIRDIRNLATVHEIALPDVGANYQNTAPTMQPFPVMQDDKVRVTAILVPHGPVFPSFAFRFDTEYGSVTFSGDTTFTPNIPTLAKNTDILVHEAINLEGFTGPPAIIRHQVTSHTPVQKVGGVAQAAGAKRLVLSHIADLTQDPIDARKWTAWAQQGYGGRVDIGEDLQRIQSGGSGATPSGGAATGGGGASGGRDTGLLIGGAVAAAGAAAAAGAYRHGRKTAADGVVEGVDHAQ